MTLVAALAAAAARARLRQRLPLAPWSLLALPAAGTAKPLRLHPAAPSVALQALHLVL